MDHFATLGARDDGPIFETWTMLAAMAQLTTRTRIGCAVVGNTYRHPGVLAKMAVTVDHLSGGRLEFGIGAGWAENEHAMLGLEFGTRNDRADRLEESVQIIRSLWTQPRTTFEGKHYRLQDAVAEPKPVQQPLPADLDRRLGAEADAADHRAVRGRVERGGRQPGRRWPRRRRSSTSTARTSGVTRARSADRCSSGSASTTWTRSEPRPTATSRSESPTSC
jgi:hypothetical protein